MNLATIIFIREWITAWRLLARHALVAFASGLIDLVFFLAFAFFTTPVFGKLTTHVIIIGSLVSEQMRAPAGRLRPAVIDTLFQEPVRQYTVQFLGLLLLLAVIVFVLFCLFQGMNWWLATSIAGKKQNWRAFLLGFARVNLLWFGLYALWYCADTVFDLRRLMLEKSLGQPAPTASIVLAIILAVLIYFAIISYPLLSIRKAFRAGTRGARVLIPAVLLILVHFLAGNLMTQWIARVNTLAMLVIGAVLLFSLLAWSRVYLARMVQRVSRTSEVLEHTRKSGRISDV